MFGTRIRAGRCITLSSGSAGERPSAAGAEDKKGEATLIRKKTGLPIDAYFSATKIEWILKNVPGVLTRAKQGKILFGTTDTWILWKLTGGRAHATDFTNASRTMLFNIETLAWDNGLLKKFNIPRRILPEVKRSSGFFGRTVQIGRLARAFRYAVLPETSRQRCSDRPVLSREGSKILTAPAVFCSYMRARNDQCQNTG